MTQRLTVRLPDDMYEQLRQAAFDQRISQNDIMVDALDAHLRLSSMKGGEVIHKDGDPLNNDLANLGAAEDADAAAARAARASIDAGEPLIPWEQVKAEAGEPPRLPPEIGHVVEKGRRHPELDQPRPPRQEGSQ